MTGSPLAIVVLAAGKGTRMKSATPKVLHPLAGRPLIAHVLGAAKQLSPQHIVAVVRHERDAVVEAVVEFAPDALVVDQDEIPGTGRAVEQAVAALPLEFDGDVIVLSGDVPLLSAEMVGELLSRHRAEQAAATVLTAILDDPSGYGRLVRDEAGAVSAIVEHADASEAVRAIGEINSGTYVFASAALRRALPSVGAQNAQGEKYLTDVIGLLRREGAVVAATAVPEAWMVGGINDRVQLAEAARIFNDLAVRRLQLSGVTIVDPATTWIDADVAVGVDTVIWPGTQLLGATTVGADAVIGPDTTLRDCEIADGATVIRTDATLAVVGEGASVGPFSYLRPGTVLDAGGKIGTFVETKNSHIGAGSKVPHLSYLGDTEVGVGSNVGAGTITANYDGVAKHRTVVGDHVRTGSHNVFVAPVRIGDGAYTGAGTVVRKDVAPGDLALTVAPQRNIAGWVTTNRPGTAAAEAATAAGAIPAADTAGDSDA